MNWICLLLMLFSPFVNASNSIGKNLFNTMQYERAKEVLPKLSESGDADASFWLALVQFRTGKSYDAGDTMLASAEQGNPWAMRLLVPEWNGYCGYLGWPCDEKWRKKAISGWEKLADKNDGKAIYALLKWGDQWWKSIPVYRDYKYSEIVDKAVRYGGYQAVTSNSDFPISQEKRIKLLNYSADKNDTNSMFLLYLNCNKGKSDSVSTHCLKFLKKALDLGDIYAANSLYERYSGYNKRAYHFDNVDVAKAYFYYSIAKYFNLTNKDFSVLNEDFNSKQNSSLEEKEKKLNRKKIAYEVDLLVKKIKPSLFYDESFPYDVLLKP